MKKSDFDSTCPGWLTVTPEGEPAFVPNQLPPSIEYMPDLVSAISEARAALGDLSGVGRTIPNPHLLIRPFLRKEAEVSSRIEGTRTALSDLYVYETDPSREPEDSDAGEIRNYIVALEHGLERRKELPIGLRFVKELHKILMTSDRGKKGRPGEFRQAQNWILSHRIQNALYVPPPIPEMTEAISDWEKFLHEKGSMPPLVRLALLHYQFEAIHPFMDGNGRVGRLLIPILLCEWQLLPQPLLYLSAYFERNRRDYFDLLLAVSQQDRWLDWILFFLRGIEEQAIDAAWRSKRLMDKWVEYRAIAQKSRNAPTVLRLIDSLIEAPACNISRVAKKFDITPTTADKAIKTLESAGVLKEITGRPRYRIWFAEEIMDILTTEATPASEDLQQSLPLH
jgi:Fic family protein